MSEAHPFEALILYFAEKHQLEDGGCTCGFCAWSPTHVAVMAYRDAAAHSTPPEPTGATLAAETAPKAPEDTPEGDEARVRRYVEALPDEGSANTYEDAARAVIAVADEEQATLRAELDRQIAGRRVEQEALSNALPILVRAEAAEAELADARERLRQAEERLATAPTIHIDRQAHAPATCKIWREGVLIFDGIDRTVLAGQEADARQRLAAVEAELVKWRATAVAPFRVVYYDNDDEHD